MILKLQGTSRGFSLKELHDHTGIFRGWLLPLVTWRDKVPFLQELGAALWFGFLGPWPRLVSPPEQSQRCPVGGAGRSQLAPPTSCLAGSWNQLWGENSHSGANMTNHSVPSSEHSAVSEEKLALVSGSSVTSCCYFNHWGMQVIILQFCYKMWLSCTGTISCTDDLLWAPATVENGSGCGTLERALGNREALRGNQSWLLFCFMAFWTSCLDTCLPLTFCLMPRFHD